MAAIVEVDVSKAREDVEALNNDIRSIAKNIGDVKSAFSAASGDFAGNMLAELQKLNGEWRAMQDTIRSLNADLTGTKSGIGALAGATDGLVTSARNASQAITAKAQALNQEKSALDQTSESVRKLSAAEAEANIRWTTQEKVIRATITAAQLKKAVTAELTQMELDGMITTQQNLRYQEQMAATYLKTGTAAEVMLQTLREENALYHASQQTILERTAGYRTMSESQMKALQTQTQLNNDLKQTNDLFKSSASILQEYDSQLLALGRVKQAGLVTESQYASALAALDRQFDDQLSKVRASTKAMQDRAYAESEAAKREKDVQDAINRTTSSVQRGLDPIAQYVARLRDLNTAAAGATTQGGGRIGLSQTQYTAGLAAARAELERNIASGMRASTVQSQLNSQFNLGAQAAAGFRAGLQGAGLGFGIFTSNTIVAATAVYGVSKAIRESILAGTEFQEAFNRAGAVLGAFDLETGKPNQSLAALRSQVMGLAETTRFSASEIAEALTSLGQAGQNVSQAMQTLPAVLNLATVGEIGTADAADKLVNVLAMFNLNASEASNVADKLTRAALESTTTIGDLAVGLGQVGATAHSAGIGLDTTLGSLALLRQVGIQASKTGTDLRNIIQSLSAPTSAASKTFAELGINTKQFFSGPGGALDLISVFETLKVKLGDLSKQQQLALAKEWFDRRSSGALLDFIDKLGDDNSGLKKYIKDISEAAGDSQRLADIINNNAKVAFSELGHTIENIAISAFTDYSGQLTDDIKQFTDYVRTNGPQIAQTIANITSSVISLTEWLVKNADTLATTFVVYEGWRTLASASQGVFGLWTRGIAAYTAATQLSTAATIENEMAVTARTAAGGRLTAEMEAELLAFNAQAAAASRAAVATGALGAAGTAAAGGLGVLRAAGSGLVAILGGWPVIITAIVGGLAYLAYQGHEALQPIQVDFQNLNERAIELSGSLANLSKLDFSGLNSLGSQVEHESDLLKQANADLQHNIDLIKEKQSVSSQQVAAWSGGSIAPTQDDLDKMNQYNNQQREITLRMSDMAILQERINFEKMFVTPSAVKTIADIQTLQGALGGIELKLPGLESGLDQFFGKFSGVGAMLAAQFKLAGFAATEMMERLRPYFEEQMGPPRSLMNLPKTGGDLGDANGAKARMQQLATEIKTVVSEFEKATNAEAEFGHQMSEINDLANQLGSGKISAELKKIGVTADEARAALDWKAGNITFESLKKTLSDMNPLFASLKDPQKDLVNTTSDLDSAYAAVDSTVQQMMARWPKFAADISAMGEEVKAQLPGILDGSTAALNHFNEVVRDQQKNLDAAFRPSGMNEFVSDLQTAGVQLDATSRGAIALESANALLGGSMKAVQKSLMDVTEAQSDANNLQQIWNALQADPVLQAAPERLAAYGKALQLVYNQTALGSLQESNRQMEIQMQLIASGTQNLDEFNTLWKLTKGGILQASDAMVEAAHNQALLNEEFSKMQAAQEAFKGLASSLGEAFANFVTDSSHSWKDFLSDIKKSFKDLLFDLIKQAATNQILFYFGFNQSGAGGGGGSLGGWIGAIMSLFGAGGGSSSSGGSGVDLSGLVANSATSGGNGYGISTAQLYNLGYNPTNMAGGSSTGLYGYIQQGQQLYSVGNFGYNLYTNGPTAAFQNQFSGYSNFFNGSGNAAPGSSWFGTNLANGTNGNVFAPTGFGYGAAVAGGLYAGYNRYQQGGALGGLAGGATYAVGGTALGLGLMGAASGAGFTAGVAAMGTGASALGASAGVAAAVPIIGWIALAMMLVDMVSGGKLFGTDANKFVGGATNLNYKDGQAALTGHYTFKGQKALFGGSYYEEKNMDITPEMQAEADKVSNQIKNFGKTAAARLGVAMADGITGDFESQFDKDGNVTKTISTVLGKTYEEPLEDFVKRMKAETVVSEIGESIAAMGGNADEASKIADRFRGNASDFLDAAEFMLQAQVDIKNGVGLLNEAGGAGVLTDTVEIVQSLQADGETLTQTYARLSQETQLVISIMDVAGSTMTRTGADFVQFSDDFVQALGGLDAAQSQWNMFSTMILQGANQITSATSSGALAGQLAALGLSADTTITEFADAFSKVSSTLDASDLAAWVQAGAALGTIQQTMIVLQGMADGVDLTSVISQQAQLIQSINTQIQAAARLGASEEQLAEMRRLGQQAIDNQLSDFMGSIDQQIQKLMGGDYAYQFEQIGVAMRRNIDTARALGASTQDLAKIQQLAAMQTAQLIAQLKTNITDLVKQLHGDTGQSQNNGGLQQQAAEGQRALRQAQKDLYDAAQRAIKDIKEFLDSLQIGDLSPDSWEGQLDTAAAQFNDLVARAQAGDTDAMAQLTQSAQDYLQHAQDAYGNSVTYGQIFDSVTSILEQLQAQFAAIPEPPDDATTVSNGGVKPVALTDGDKFSLAMQIANQIGALGLALNVSVFDLMDKFDVSLQELASDMGININDMSEETINGLVILAGALHIDVLDLMQELGATPEAIGAYFQVTADQINAGNLENIKNMADTLGISVYDAITFVGGDLKLAIQANGISLDALNTTMIEKLGTIASTLGVDIVSLLTQLGVDVSTFAQPLSVAISEDLSKIPGLSAETVAGMAPLLTALGLAITTGDLSTALDDINAYLATLPEDQRKAIEDLFTSLGISLDGTTTAVNTQTDVQTTISTNTADTVTAIGTLDTTIHTAVSEPLGDIIGISQDMLSELRRISSSAISQPGGAGGTSMTVGGEDVTGGRGTRGAGAHGANGMQGGSMFVNPEDFGAAAGEVLFETINTTEGNRQLAEQQQRTNDALQNVSECVDNLTATVASKLDQAHETQKSTSTATKRLVKQGKTSKVSRGTKKK